MRFLFYLQNNVCFSIIINQAEKNQEISLSNENVPNSS